MKYEVLNGYYILNVDGKYYVVDETSACSFVLRKKDTINLNGKTFSPRFASGKHYFESLIGHKIDGFICRDIIDAVGGIEMENCAVVFGQQRSVTKKNGGNRLNDNVIAIAFEDEEDREPSGKMNSRKQLAPLFVYEILKNCSNSCRRLTQNEILRRLDAFPYQLSIERKALGRTLHLLEDSDLGVHNSRNGSWYEPYKFCA